MTKKRLPTADERKWRQVREKTEMNSRNKKHGQYRSNAYGTRNQHAEAQ